jgi:hypothetical protein
MSGLGLFFAGFGVFFACIGRLNQSKIAKAEHELEESQRFERAPAREGGSQ